VGSTGGEGGAVVRGVLTSLGQLKFCPPGLLDAICGWYDRQASIGSREAATLLVTLANLNHRPPRHPLLLRRLADSLEPDQFRQLGRYEVVWLDVVWALAALDLAAHHHLASVLNSSFHNLLLYSTETRNLGASIKLLNVNAAAKLLHTDYTGPVLNIEEDALLRDIKIAPALAKVQLRQRVLESLASLAPPPRFLSLEVNSLLGCWIDGELVCNSRGAPEPLQELKEKFPQAALPEGSHKVAVLVASFQDCLISGPEAGAMALGARLLRAQGYKVVVVRHDQVPPTLAAVERVRVVEELLQAALGLRGSTTGAPGTDLN